MGRRGPPKKTTEENARNGNPGKRAQNKLEPEFEIDEDLPCPKDLGALGRDEWKRVGPMLVEYGVLRKSERTIFHNYCKILDEIGVQERLRRTFYDNANIKMGLICQKLVVQLRTQLRHYQQELGLTPASRSSVKAGRPKGKNGTQAQTGKDGGQTKGNIVRFFKNQNPTKANAN